MKTIRIRTIPGREAGLWVSLTGLSIRRPGHVQSEQFTVTYYDRKGRARREHGGPILPGPYAYVTDVVELDEDLLGFETVREGDLLLIGEDRFSLGFDSDGRPELEHRPPEAVETDAPLGLELSVVRRKVDGTLGGVSRYADTLVLVGFLDSRKLPARIVTPLPADCRRFAPSNTSPAVAIEVNAGLLGKPVAVHPVYWNDVESAYIVERRGVPGGNFAAWSDARIGEELTRYYSPGIYGALHIHDRSDH